MKNISSKMVEVAELPLKLNLQLFADDDFDYEDESSADEITEEIESENEPETTELSDKAEKPEVADPEKDKTRQDSETNRKFQEMRQKVEAAERKAKEQDTWVSKTFGDTHGLKTWDDYQKFVEKERERAQYEELGVDPEAVEEIVNKKLDNHPAVLAAREREKEAFQSQQIEKLNKTFDLGIKTVEDIRSLPNADAMIQKIVAGYDWDDAYLATHRDHVTQKMADRAKQAERNNQQSKAHLKTTTGGGDVDGFTMPQEVLQEYRRAFAKEYRKGTMTDKDFIAHYRKSNKK